MCHCLVLYMKCRSESGSGEVNGTFEFSWYIFQTNCFTFSKMEPRVTGSLAVYSVKKKKYPTKKQFLLWPWNLRLQKKVSLGSSMPRINEHYGSVIHASTELSHTSTLHTDIKGDVKDIKGDVKGKITLCNFKNSLSHILERGKVSFPYNEWNATQPRAKTCLQKHTQQTAVKTCWSSMKPWKSTDCRHSVCR